MDVTRRQFVKAAAVSAAMAAAGGSLVMGAQNASAATSSAEAEAAAGGSTITSGVCRYCGCGCGVLVETNAEGRVIAVTGDPDNRSSKGLNCVKGYYLSKALYGEDRLTVPLIRDDPSTKGTGSGLREATWEEALDLAASKLKTAWETAVVKGDGSTVKGSSRIAFWGSGQMPITEGYLLSKFWKAGLKSNNVDPNARLCMASAVVGFMNVFQTDEPAGCYADLENADVFVTWGANMAEAHPILYSRLTAHKLADSNVKHYDLTALRTRTSATADKVMVFKPGSDIAIANAILKYLVDNNLYDEAFVNDHVQFKVGEENIGNAYEDTYDKSPDGSRVDKVEVVEFDAWKERLAPYTLEYAEEISGVPAADIEELAKVFGDKEKKVMSLWTMGVNQHNRGTWMNHCIYNIHLLTGKIAKPGNGPFSLTGQPTACGTAREVGTFSHRLPTDLVVANEQHRRFTEAIWDLPEGYLDAIKAPGFHTVKIFREMSKGNIDFLWTAHNNWAVSMPNLTRFLGKKEDFDGIFKTFVVVNEVYPTASTDYADVVFPVAMWVEKEGQFGNAERRTTVFQKAANPPGEAQWDQWVLMQMAQRVLEGHMIAGEDRFDKLFGAFWDKNATSPNGLAGNWVAGEDQTEVNRAIWSEYRLFSNPKEASEKAQEIASTKDEEKNWLPLKMENKQLAPYDEYIKQHGIAWPVREVNGEWVETNWRFSGGKQEEGFDQYGIEEYGKTGLANDVCFYKSAGMKPSVVFRPWEPPAYQPDEEYPFWLCTGRLLEHWHSGSMTGRVPELQRAVPEGLIYMNAEDCKNLGINDGDMVKVTSPYGTTEVKATTDQRFAPEPGMTFVAMHDNKVLINLVVQDVYCPLSKEPDFKKTVIKIEKA